MIGTRHFQVLACEVSLETTCPEIAARLEYVTAGAVQEYPVSRRVAYGIDRAGEEYLLREDGDACYRNDCADRVVIELFRRMHGVVYGQMRGRLRLHAGCAEYQGRAFLAVGPKGAGKSTLMARLVFEGFSVSGDEMVFVLGREVTALPRRFHLKPPAIGLLPQVAALADRLPFVLGDDGRKIIATKVAGMLRRGPAGWWRVLKNGWRFLVVRHECPETMESWQDMLHRAGFEGVSAGRVVAEAAVTTAWAPGSGPSPGAVATQPGHVGWTATAVPSRRR